MKSVIPNFLLCTMSACLLLTVGPSQTQGDDKVPSDDKIVKLLQQAEGLTFQHRQRVDDKVLEWTVDVPKEKISDLFADVRLESDTFGILFIKSHRGHVVIDGKKYKIKFGDAKISDQRIKVMVRGPDGWIRLRIDGDARQTFRDTIHELVAKAKAANKGQVVEAR